MPLRLKLPGQGGLSFGKALSTPEILLWLPILHRETALIQRYSGGVSGNFLFPLWKQVPNGDTGSNLYLTLNRYFDNENEPVNTGYFCVHGGSVAFNYISRQVSFRTFSPIQSTNIPTIWCPLGNLRIKLRKGHGLKPGSTILRYSQFLVHLVRPLNSLNLFNQDVKSRSSWAVSFNKLRTSPFDKLRINSNTALSGSP